MKTYRSCEAPAAVPSRAWTPTTSKRRPPTRSGRPMGSRPGKRASATSAPITATAAARVSSSRERKRPRSRPRSRISARAAEVPVIAAFSSLRPPALTSPARCAEAA